MQEKAPSPVPEQKPSKGIKRDLTKDERAELRTARAIKNLVATEGWKVYKAILELHLQGKRNEFEQPAEVANDGISQVLRSESAKGAIMGLRLALSIPDGILSNDKIMRANLGIIEEDDE